MQEDDIDTGKAQPRRRRLIAVAVFVLVIVSGVLFLMMRSENPREYSLKPETPREAYLKILGETHTGLRLVRLQDFLEYTPTSADHARAKTARDILAKHEQIAWAKLTYALYDLNKSAAQKQQALTTYKTNWGIWSRKQDLPNLLQVTLPETETAKTTQYAPDSHRSRFRKDGGDTMLAGEVPTAAMIQPPTKKPYAKSKQPVIKAARIKFAKRPRYPRRARRKGIEATVTLALDIDERGRVARTKVVSIHTPRYEDKFIRAARKAARGSRFYPRTINGKPVASSDYLRKYTFSSAE